MSKLAIMLSFARRCISFQTTFRPSRGELQNSNLPHPACTHLSSSPLSGTTTCSAPGVQLQTLIVPSQGIANKVGRGPSSTASSSTSNSSVQHGRPTVVSDRRASDSAITRVSQGIQAHNGGEQIFQFPLGPPQSTMSMHRRHSSVIQTTPGHSPQAMQPPNPAFYITPGSSSQVMQSSPQAANSANAPGAQPFPYFQQPNSYHQQAPSQPVRYSKNPAKRPRLQQNESTPPMVSLSRAPPPMYAEASNSRQGPPIPNGQAAYPVSQPMAPPPHMIGRPNLPVQRLPDPVNATAVQNVPRSETPDLVGISMSLGTTQQVPRVLSAPNMSSSASSISPASSVRPPSPPVRESARPSEEPTGHLSTSPLAQYVNVARSSAPSPQVATGLPHQSPTSSIDTQATDAIGGGGATPHEAMTPAPIHQTIIEEANESSAGDHQVDEIMMDYSHTTDDIKESSDVGVVADSLPPVEADADMDMPLAHDENVDEDEEEDEDDNWADLTDDEAGDRRPVIECVSSVFFDAADEERYCQLCNLRVETKLMEVAPTFSESGMRDLVRHLKEEHPAAWLKLRSREDSTKTEPTPS
ncbi:hypothetical protein BD410DRAFT_10790 [Rickenella mellea]|uniref:Uncharacterized protein n=1 Tax=Rickenella mellea TaxID=50990 RepID=A0A4R5XGE2_9AGAM|nr:hypothetical protein BD410DRAFT_10790 [Rickenella mellea]